MRRDRHCQSGMETSREEEVVFLPDNRVRMEQQNRAFEWIDRPVLFLTVWPDGAGIRESGESQILGNTEAQRARSLS